ncbi:unnamed protein product [Echinostoma caproni]|uniref:CARD domain-containing protein n=1 Tax=Echinostoma caproni TaxID=27848 RepID=A0A183B922_9TREM|nr:unnamed protein product [Echinostoma caproni]
MLSGNTLVRDTLNELRVNPQNTLLEPSTLDYVNLVNKGEFFTLQTPVQQPGQSRAADEKLIEHFSTLTRKLRHIMSWSFIKDPVSGDLCLNRLEESMARGINITRSVVQHIEDFMAGAAKSRNVVDLVQRAVSGNAEATQELSALLGSGRCSYLLTTVQEAQGQVADRLLRHCATDCKVRAIESLLKKLESKAEDEIEK